MALPHKTNGAVRFFTHHRNASNLLMIILVLSGMFALSKLKVQFFPSVEIPVITVNVVWPGASPEDVEKSILKSLEPELRFTDGLSEFASYAREGVATIRMEFEGGTNMQSALSDVESAVNNVTTLPEESERPVIRQHKFFEDVASLSISGPYSELALKSYARKIRDGLLEAGIDQVNLNGFRDEEIWVNVRSGELRRLDLTVADIASKIAQISQDLPSGTLDGAIDRQIRSIGQAEDTLAVSRIEVKSLASGEKIYLRDIATIETRFDKDAAISFQGKDRAIGLGIKRALAADTLVVAKILNDYLDSTLPTLPPDLKVVKYDVAADAVSDRINLLLKNGAGGLVLVLIILFIFLNARIAFWVAVGIPVSVMATLGIMYLTGQTINMISLFALILTLGIIVDDAIVVGEHTATCWERGDSALAAAERGATRMLAPVVAATLTTQAAFLPLFLIGGIIGDIIAALPAVVIAVLVASVVECFFILPGHLRHTLSRMKSSPSAFRRGFDRHFGTFRDNWFGRFSACTFRWRYTTMAAAIGILIISIGVMKSGRVTFQFFPTPEPEIILANVVFVAGTPREVTAAALTRIEASLTRVVDELAPGKEKILKTTYSTLGTSGQSRGDHLARIKVQLARAEQRSVRTNKIIEEWRKAVPQIPGVERISITGRRGGPPGRDIDIQLSGGSPATLKKAALELRQLLGRYPGVSGIADDLPYGKQEIILQITPRGSALGFTTASVGRQVRNAFEGAIAKRFARGDEEITIRVRQDKTGIGSQSLRDLFVRSPQGAEVPLTEVVNLREKAGFSLIQRREGKTSVAVTADIDAEVTTSIIVESALKTQGLKDIAAKYRIDYEFKGKSEERNETFGDLRIGVILALTLMYIILAWTFGSYIKPIIVMLIIPFGLVGAIFGHLVMGFPMTILSFFGLLGLSGILVNDSIILVVQVDKRLNEGETMEEAASGGARDRLRAVLLTSLTTIGGLTPLMFEKSLQAQFLLPMAITLVFGLAVATILVLILVPAILGIQNDVTRFFRWYWNGIPMRPSSLSQ
jgi:multidrug efflux pump subunit AcrB